MSSQKLLRNDIMDQQTSDKMRKVFNSGADQVLVKPPPKLNAMAHVVLPAPTRGFKDVDPSDVDVRALFSRIAKEYSTKLEVEERETAITVTVQASNRAKAQRAIVAVREQLLYQPGDEGVWCARLFIYPPKEGKASFNTVLQPRDGTTGRRATAAHLDGPKLVDPGDVLAGRNEYRDHLTQALDRLTLALRNVTSGMRMRLQFGELLFDEWKKDKLEYNFAELTNLTCRAGRRDTAHMMCMLDPAAVKLLKSHLVPSNTALPDFIRENLDTEPEHTHSIILETKNLHVESTFEPVQGKGVFSNKTRAVRQYALGPLTTYQQEKQGRAAEIVTVCPESFHDWALEIKKMPNHDTTASPPFSVQELEKNVRFKEEAFGGGFPNISILDNFIHKHDIQGIHGRSTWRYTLNPWYTLEITFFHRWERKTSTPPVTTSSVTLYSPEWDDDMIADAAIPRQWQSSFAQQFLERPARERAPGEGNGAQPIENLLCWVRWIRTMLDHAAQRSKPAGGA